jgi:hypothetical protein
MFGTHTQRKAEADPPSPWKLPTNSAAREDVKRGHSRGGFLLGVLSSAALVVTFVGISSSASAADTSNWKLGYYTPSPHGTISNASVTGVAPALATFNFTNLPNTALLITDQGSNKAGVLGNDAELTITANFTISGATGTFTYFGEPDGSGVPATVRLFFQTKGGPFAYTNYWWSDAAFTPLGNGTFTLTATVDAAQAWSDWNGQPSSANAAAFTAAASDVTSIGLSFGGGYFFENGVGTADGSGAFTLTSYAVS